MVLVRVTTKSCLRWYFKPIPKHRSYTGTELLQSHSLYPDLSFLIWLNRVILAFLIKQRTSSKCFQVWCFQLFLLFQSLFFLYFRCSSKDNTLWENTLCMCHENMTVCHLYSTVSAVEHGLESQHHLSAIKGKKTLWIICISQNQITVILGRTKPMMQWWCPYRIVLGWTHTVTGLDISITWLMLPNVINKFNARFQQFAYRCEFFGTV